MPTEDSINNKSGNVPPQPEKQGHSSRENDEGAAPSGHCGHAACPGCPAIDPRLEGLMSLYVPDLMPLAEWRKIAPEACCILRRSCPVTESQVRTRLAGLVGFAAWVGRSDDSLAQLLSEARIRQFTCPARGKPKPSARSRLELLRRAAHGLPPTSARRRASTKAVSRNPRRATVRRLAVVGSGVPLVECLTADPMTHRQLQTVINRLPDADLTLFRVVLRG